MEKVLEIVDLRLRLLVVIATMTQIADEVEFRTGHHLLDIRKEDVLVPSRITCIAEKITINNVFQFVCHSVPTPSNSSRIMLPLFEKFIEPIIKYLLYIHSHAKVG